MRSVEQISSDISSYKRKLSRYLELLDDVKKSVKKLNEGKTDLVYAKKKIEQGFKINNDSVDKGKLDDMIDEIDKVKNKLSGTISNQISDEISSIRRKLKRLDDEMESARLQ